MKWSEAKEGVRVRYTPVTNDAIVDVIDHCGTLEKPNPLAESGCYVKFDSGPKHYCTYRNLTVLEPKFKLNDRVKYIGKHDPSYPYMIGKLGVVMGIHPNDNDVAHVMFDGAVATLPCAAENLESWPEPPCEGKTGTEWSNWVDSPIVTETRRYVKEGQYGNLTVYEGPIKDIRIEFTTCSHTPEQMRAAAKVLNQIAEVLEENAS